MPARDIDIARHQLSRIWNLHPPQFDWRTRKYSEMVSIFALLRSISLWRIASLRYRPLPGASDRESRAPPEFATQVCILKGTPIFACPAIDRYTYQDSIIASARYRPLPAPTLKNLNNGSRFKYCQLEITSSPNTSTQESEVFTEKKPWCHYKPPSTPSWASPRVATKEEIEDARCREALIVHPDKNPKDAAETNTKFLQVSTEGK